MAGLTQPALAQQVGVTPQLISVWERAYQHQGRYWKPDRQMTLGLLEAFAERLTPGEALHWAGLAGHNLNPVELQSIFPTYWAQAPTQLPPLTPFYIERPHLQETILDQLETASNLALVGPGGTGKTSLAAWATRFLAEHFSDGVIWVDNLASNDVETAQRWIARSFEVTLNGSTPAERAAELRTLLCDKQCLLVLDDVWAGPDLVHLQVVNPHSCLLLTSRDLKVADMLNIPFLGVGGLTMEEGVSLLAAWVGHSLRAEELVSRLGGLPLALSLSGAQLRAGNLTLDSLLAHFRQAQVDLSLLDLDEAQTRTESLNICFDLSYGRLGTKDQQRLAQLGCFISSFEAVAVAAVWGVKAEEVHSTLRRLRRLAWLEQTQQGYRLHPLLRDYTRQQLMTWPDLSQRTFHRYATWFIRFALYHPAVLEDVKDPAPDLNLTWGDVVSGVKWAVTHEPQLAAQAVLLAHTERPALLETVGPGLIEAMKKYIGTLTDQSEQALMHEFLGDMYLGEGEFESGLNEFLQAADLWAAEGHWLDGSRALVRAAGVHLLDQNQPKAAATARQAQSWLAKALPIKAEEHITAKWLFYWFDVLYNALVRWPELPEEDVARLAQLGEQTGQPILIARGLHIYRLWCTVEDIPRSEAIRAKGRALALRAYHYWRACGRMDQADDEVSFAQYQLDRRYSQRAAARYARRRSRSTPRVSPAQIELAKNEAVRWWLGATEVQRVDWFSRMLPRYLGAHNNSKPPRAVDSRARKWIDDILTVSILGGEGRVLMGSGQPPTGHILTGPEWLALSGRRIRPLSCMVAKEIVHRYLLSLEFESFQ